MSQHGAHRELRCPSPATLPMSPAPPPPLASAAARARGSSTPLSPESSSRTVSKPRAPTSLLARRGTSTGALPLSLTAEAAPADSAATRPNARPVSITPAPVKISDRGQRPWQRPWGSTVASTPVAEEDAEADRAAADWDAAWAAAMGDAPPGMAAPPSEAGGAVAAAAHEGGSQQSPPRLSASGCGGS